MKDHKYQSENEKMKADDLGEWIQDMVQDAVESMDFSGLSQNIYNAVDSAKKGISRQFYNQQAAERQKGARYGQGARTSEERPPRRDKRKQREEERRKKIKKPVEARQPKAWLRRLPGRWSGPVAAAAGVLGVILFGALSVGYGLAGIGFGLLSGAVSTAAIVLESVFIPLTIISAVLIIAGKNAGKRAARIRKYAGLWGERSFIMLDDLRAWTGYSMKQIQKDIKFLLERHLLPFARMDESKTCLILTEEAGRQYDAALESRKEREKEEALQQKAREEKEAESKAPLTEEEKKILEIQETAERYLQEIQKWREQIETPEIREKIHRLEVLLHRIFMCVKEYPENLSQADRLTAYYIPSVIKLLRVYEDMEKQPVQSANILKTRMEIAKSLETVNEALENMYNDLFQDVAMDVSSDIKVLEAMLAKDGWGGQKLHPAKEEKKSIWE